MSKPIKLKEKTWDKLYARLKEDYKSKPSTILVRSRMRNILGFTQRHYRAFHDIDTETGVYFKESYVALDFYDDKKYTMFLLKYGSFLDGQPDN